MAAPPVGQQQPAAPVEESRLLSDEQVMQAIATFQVGDHVIAIGVQWVNGYLAAVENSPDFMIGDVRIDVPFVAQCRGVTIKRHGTPDVVLKAELKRHAPVAPVAPVAVQAPAAPIDYVSIADAIARSHNIDMAINIPETIPENEADLRKLATAWQVKVRLIATSPSLQMMNGYAIAFGTAGRWSEEAFTRHVADVKMSTMLAIGQSVTASLDWNESITPVTRAFRGIIALWIMMPHVQIDSADFKACTRGPRGPRSGTGTSRAH